VIGFTDLGNLLHAKNDYLLCKYIVRLIFRQ
jgi:hypothetical protein